MSTNCTETYLLNKIEPVRREIFDASKEEHLNSLKNYVQTGNWGSVQFFTELPYTNTPTTVLMKYTKYMLK